MDVLSNMISHHAFLFVLWNALGMIAGMVLVVPVKKQWQEYLIVIYGGLLFGMIPFWYLSESLAFALVGSIVLVVLLGLLHCCYGKQISVPLVVFLSRVVLLLGITIGSEEYFENQWNYYLLCISLAVIVSILVHIVCEQSYVVKWSQMICPAFGILEISGALVQFYRMDYTYFLKDLQSGEVISFFLHLLRIDFGIYDYQDVCFFLTIGLLMIYFIFCKMHRKQKYSH